MTNGVIAFDYHGYCRRQRLLEHHRKGWASRNPGWGCAIEGVDFDPLSTAELNQRKTLGPDQYLHDPIPRARNFINRRDHTQDSAKARKTICA
ncbi:hypothetical protein EV128_12177 [Rhizobium azibense]|nr:hypothetical protein EV128_12177 [Rhizobium azibense]